MAKKIITANYTTYAGTSKKDKIYIDYADYVFVSTGAGNDSVYNEYGWYDTISTGSGNDTIKLYYGKGSSVNAGTGNDKISLYGGSAYVVTLVGGKGNDTVYTGDNSALYRYTSGDGNDIIFNWSANDTLQITGSTYTKKTSGNNVILTIGSGKITLKGAKGQTLNIDGTLAGGGKNINNSTSKKKLNGTSYADTFTNSGSYVTISGGKGNDTISNVFGNNTSIVAGTGNDSIYNRSFYTTILGGAGKDTVYNHNGEWASINTGDGNDSIYNVSTYDDDGYYVTISGGAGNDTIKNEYGNYASIFAGIGNDSIYNRSYSTTINGGTGNDTMTNFNAALTSVNGGAGNDLIKLGGDIDYASGNVTVKGGTGKDTISISGSAHSNIIQYASGDGNDVIYGLGSTDTLKITGAKYTRSTVGNDVVLKVGKGSITLKDAASTTINIQGTLKGGGSTSTVQPAPAPSSDDIYGTSGHDYLKVSVGGSAAYGYDGNDTITNYSNNVYISGGNGNDSIKSGSYASNVTVHGGAGNDKISVSGSDAQIYGETGNDSIYVVRCDNGYIDGGSGNDTIGVWSAVNLTLKGGTGDDRIELSRLNNPSCVIQYASGDGNDTVTGFSDNDTLKITGAKYTRSTVGNDVVFKVGSGKITLKNAKNTTINIGTTYYASDDVLDESDDVIYSSDSNFNGNNTIRGTKGNDSLWGTEDVDMFIYKSGDGKDVIFGFENNDLLKITGAFSTPTYNASAKSVAFKVGTGSVTLKDFGSTTLFHVNNDTYQLSGTKLVKK